MNEKIDYSDETQGSHIVNIFSGFIAGTAAAITTNPFDLGIFF